MIQITPLERPQEKQKNVLFPVSTELITEEKLSM